MIPEIVRQEEVPVFVVLVDGQFKGPGLYASLQVDGTGLGVLLGYNGGHSQFAKL